MEFNSNEMAKKIPLGRFPSDKIMSKEVWNDRYARAFIKISLSSPEQIRNDPFVKKQIKIYLKGHYIK